MRAASVASADGTAIAFHSLGQGPGLVLVGGVLSSGVDYMPLAAKLADRHTVHVIERRGRPGSGPMRSDHDIATERADLSAVAAATDSRAAFGHSFGGLVALETARHQPIFDELFVYEPGVSLRGQIATDWLDGYERRLAEGDRRGAFAWMVKNGDFAGPLASLPLWAVSLLLRGAVRDPQWQRMDPLLEAALVEHRILGALDAPTPERFATITADTLLMGGSKSPDAFTGPMLRELATAIPRSTVAVLPGLGHTAPTDDPDQIAVASRIS